MNAKENLLRVIRHDHPEYVPLGLGGTLREISFDVVEWPDAPGLDAWGVRWDVANKDVGAYPVEHPLKSLDDLDRLAMPDFGDAAYQQIAREWLAACSMGILPMSECSMGFQPMSGTGVPPVSQAVSSSSSSHVQKQQQQQQKKQQDMGKMPMLREEFMLMGRVGETLFERAWMLMGMEGLMVAFYETPDRLKELFARIAAVRAKMVARHIASGCEAVIFADDYGGQDGMLISPASWREFIKPHLAALYRQAKQAGMMVVQHSCGCNGPILGDLVEMGLDVWHPCQPTSNDLAALKKQFAGRLTFYGAINSYVLDRGSPDDVRAEVRLRIRQLAAGGGFIAAPSHGVPYRQENLDAMADEVARAGRYGSNEFEAIFKG